MLRKIFILLLAFSILLPVRVYGVELENNDGGEQIIEIIDEAIKLDLSVFSQTYPAKEITLKISIKPEINIARAQVSWIFNDRLFEIIGDSNELINIRAGEELVLYKSFNIKQVFAFKESIDNDFGVKVTGLAFDRNYLSTRKLTININYEFEVVPLLAEYQQQKTIILIIYWLLGIVGVGVVLWLIVFAIKRFQKYLNTD